MIQSNNRQPVPAGKPGITTFAELHRRRRIAEAQAGIEEVRLVETVRKVMRPFTLVRSVSSFAFNRIFNSFTLVDGLIYGFRSAGWLTNIIRRIFRR